MTKEQKKEIFYKLPFEIRYNIVKPQLDIATSAINAKMGILPLVSTLSIAMLIVATLRPDVIPISIFWVKTSGMDAKAQAHKIASSGLQVAGFRQDERILESILDRYIMPLTVMGGAAIGLLAASTDLLGALVSGTAILLVIMIMFQLYQNIVQQLSIYYHH